LLTSSANFFSLDPPAQIGYEQHVAMQGNQAVGLVQDQLTGALFQPYYLGAQAAVAGGPLCLAGVDTTRDRDVEPSSIPAPSLGAPRDETDGSVRDLTVFTTVDAYYNLASAGATCDPALADRRDTSAPDLSVVSLAKDSPQAAEERDAFTEVGDPVPVIPGIGAGSAGGIPRVAYVISEPGDHTAALVDLDTPTLLINGAYEPSEIANLMTRLETR
jgi:hypothetical protein